VDGVERDDLAGAGHVFETGEDHRLALLRRQLLERRDDAADRDDLTVAAPLELAERAVGLPPQLVADRRQRVLRDVETERLLLEPQQLALVVLRADGDRRMVARRGVAAGDVAEVEDRPLAEQPVGLLALPPRERLLETLEHYPARPRRRIERAAFDERLERALVHDLRIDALREVPDRRERPALLACAHDRAARGLADVLHRVQAEADLALDDGEVDLRRV